MPLRKAVVILLILLFQLTIIVSPAMSAPQVVGEAAILLDSKTGKVLYDKNGHASMAPASTTKVLTVAVALEAGKLDDVVTISKTAATQEGSSIYSREGEKFTLKQLLYAVMLQSANDGAMAVAEHIGGSKEQFDELMNKKAREWGAKNSHFANPNGLPNPDHYTTAYDMAMITKHAMTNPMFRQIVSTEVIDLPRTDPQSPKRFWNHNKLIRKGGRYFYEGANGVKTGYTVEAQQCLVSSANRKDQEFVAVVFASAGGSIWTDSQSLLDYGFANFRTVQLVAPGVSIKEVPVKGGAGRVKLVTESGLYYTLGNNEQLNPTSKIELFPEISAPIETGQKLGEVRYYREGTEIGAVSLVAEGKVAKKALARPAVVGPVLGGSAIIGGALLLGAAKRRRRRQRRYKTALNRNIFR